MQAEKVEPRRNSVGKKKKKRIEFPALEEIEQELERLRDRKNWRRALRSTIYTLIVVAAVAVLVAILYLPVLRVVGNSMEPNLNDGDIIVGVKSGDFEAGEICCFYYNNKLLLKRVIATEGEWVEIDEAGNVTVNGTALVEPYVQDRSLGICDIEFPYTVPEGHVFVLGDNRNKSEDSRWFGPINEQQILGRVLIRLFRGFGRVE